MTLENPLGRTVIAIVTWNNETEIAECLQSISDLPKCWEIWVSDNNSSDRTVEIVKTRFPNVHLIENKENLGFAAGCNKIAENSTSEFLLFLNPDTRATGDNLEKALSELKNRPQIGVLSVKMLDENGHLQKTCYRFPSLKQNLLERLPIKFFISDRQKSEIFLGDYFDHFTSRPIDWIYGAMILVRRRVFEEVGGIPEDYFLFAEDLDFCFQVARKGYQNWFLAEAEIVHKANKSAGQLPSEWRIERTIFSHYAFCFKNYGVLKTRLLQIIDLFGSCSDALNLKLRKGGTERLRENRIYRGFILKAWRSSRLETFELLQKRPENE